MYKFAVGAVLAVCAAGTAMAQSDWPTRPVRIVVPFAAGGNTDAVTRLLSARLGQKFNQSFVIENRAGAGGVVASNYVASAPPDGYLLFMSSTGAHVISPHLGEKLNYDPIKSFDPISNVSSNAQVLLVHPSVPADSVQSLIAYAKKNPGTLNYASSGPGGTMHLAGEMFKAMANIDMTHVPFRGGAPATLATVAGDVHLVFANLSDALPQMQGGKLRALAVTSAQRQPQAPDLPTISESGLPGYESIVWNGLVAPAGTPKEVIERVSQAVQEIAKETDFQKRLEEIGSVPIGNSAEQFAAFIKDELQRWGKVVEVAGAQTKK